MLLKLEVKLLQKALAENKQIKIVGKEEELKYSLKLNGLDFNLIGKADRVDFEADTLRIIDYKTGKAEALEVIFEQVTKSLHLVCLLEISDDEVIKRLTGRFFCAECGKGYHQFFEKPKKASICDICGSLNVKRRSDDLSEVFKTRLNIYHNHVRYMYINSFYTFFCG